MNNTSQVIIMLIGMSVGVIIGEYVLYQIDFTLFLIGNIITVIFGVLIFFMLGFHEDIKEYITKSHKGNVE